MKPMSSNKSKGHALVRMDYSQIEKRVLASLTPLAQIEEGVGLFYNSTYCALVTETGARFANVSVHVAKPTDYESKYEVQIAVYPEGGYGDAFVLSLLPSSKRLLVSKKTGEDPVVHREGVGAEVLAISDLEGYQVITVKISGFSGEPGKVFKTHKMPTGGARETKSVASLFAKLKKLENT